MMATGKLGYTVQTVAVTFWHYLLTLMHLLPRERQTLPHHAGLRRNRVGASVLSVEGHGITDRQGRSASGLQHTPPRPPRRTSIAIARAAPSSPPTALPCSALLPPSLLVPRPTIATAANTPTALNSKVRGLPSIAPLCLRLPLRVRPHPPSPLPSSNRLPFLQSFLSCSATLLPQPSLALVY